MRTISAKNNLQFRRFIRPRICNRPQKKIPKYKVTTRHIQIDLIYKYELHVNKCRSIYLTLRWKKWKSQRKIIFLNSHMPVHNTYENYVIGYIRHYLSNTNY